MEDIQWELKINGKMWGEIPMLSNAP
jgi:hypothetical protein